MDDTCSQDISRGRQGLLQSGGRASFLLLCLLIALLTACSSSAVTATTGGETPTSQATTPPQTTPVKALSKALTYVALGASDAVGVGSSEPGAQGYVPLIAKRLPTGSHALNLGVSGIHLHEALSEELPLALTTSPQLITIWLVANDYIAGVSYQSYMSDLNSLLSQLHTRTQARIVMANLPNLALLPAFSQQTSAQKVRLLQNIKHWDQGIAQLAARYSVALVDLLQEGSEITAHPQYISGDGFHPSAQGYVRLAEIFWQVIQPA